MQVATSEKLREPLIAFLASGAGGVGLLRCGTLFPDRMHAMNLAGRQRDLIIPNEISSLRG
jgi:hypothetical protein